MTPQQARTTAIRRVLWIILGLNLAVAAAKLAWGHLTGSISMWADGVHSAFDATSNVVGLVGIWAAARPASDCHPYGHRKFETFASFGISVLLFLACAHILYDSYRRFVGGGAPDVTGWSFVLITATMAVNAFVIRYEHRKGDALKSEVLHADAVHTQSDLYSSIAVVASLAAAKGGFALVDPIAAVLIAFLIGRAGFEILAETSRVLSDSARIDPARIQEIALQVAGVLGCHGVRTRGTQHHIYVDCHITVPHDMMAEHAHELVHQVEGRIRAEMAEIVDVVIHIEPVQNLIRVGR